MDSVQRFGGDFKRVQQALRQQYQGMMCSIKLEWTDNVYFNPAVLGYTASVTSAVVTEPLCSVGDYDKKHFLQIELTDVDNNK